MSLIIIYFTAIILRYLSIYLLIYLSIHISNYLSIPELEISNFVYETHNNLLQCYHSQVFIYLSFFFYIFFLSSNLSIHLSIYSGKHLHVVPADPGKLQRPRYTILILFKRREGEQSWMSKRGGVKHLKMIQNGQLPQKSKALHQE